MSLGKISDDIDPDSVLAEVPEEAANLWAAFMKGEDCCAELLYARKLRERARTARLGKEQFLLLPNQHTLHAWLGNSSPILTVALAETQHAHVSNKFKGKWWRQGLEPVLQDTFIQKWRATVPDRV